MADLGLGRGRHEPVNMMVDATAALGMMSKAGLGRTMHLDTECLWLQYAVRAQRLVPCKVGTGDNVADMFTKCVPMHICQIFME